MSRIFDEILKARRLDDPRKRAEFLSPDYTKRHNPFLLPDMEKAVERLVEARKAQERITIYGDYDIDGLTATTVLLDALESFGFEHVEAFIPNRFREGYGLTVDAVERIAGTGAQLIITVDCGSLSTKEIERAQELSVDVIVTDHHNVQKVQPPAVAVINPKRLLQEYPEMYENYILKQFVAAPSKTASPRRESVSVGSRAAVELAALKQSSLRRDATSPDSRVPADVLENEATRPIPRHSDSSPARHSELDSESMSELYPFLDLPGVGVAFKLVQALQTRLDGLPKGQEKWLLDLVALGTVCDVVTLQDENRVHVYWGLKVLSKTRRPGLKALMAVAGVDAKGVNTRNLGFQLGPRMNAAGRLETAVYALEMLRARDGMDALEKARKLDEMNTARRAEQDKILKSALVEAGKYTDGSVLVVAGEGWNHGIVGIVAAKLLEKYGKPTFVLAIESAEHERSARALGGGDETSNLLRSESEGSAPPQTIAKGSARSYGDFSAADAIRSADDIIIKGGGHKLAAGVTLPAANIQAFRERVNNYYREQGLKLFEQQQKLLPSADIVAEITAMSEELLEEISTLEPFGQGNPQPVLKSESLLVKNVRRMGAEGQHVKLTLASGDKTMDFLAFSAPEHFFVEPGEVVTVWYTPELNEWRGNRSIEGRILHLEASSDA